MDEKTRDTRTEGRRRADVDDAGRTEEAPGRMQPTLGADETPGGDVVAGPIMFDVVEEVFVPLDAGVEPDRRELVAGRVNAEYAKVTGVAAVTQADKALVRGISGITVGEKAKVTGFAPIVVSSKKAKIKKGAAMLAVSGHEIEAEDNGFIGIAVAPKVEVEEGGKVLITPMIAILIGLAFGLGFGVMALAGVWMFRGGMRMMRRRRGMLGMRRSTQRQLERRYHDVTSSVRHGLGQYADRARDLYRERVQAR